MLHTKSQGHWPSGSGEEDFLKVFTVYGLGLARLIEISVNRSIYKRKTIIDIKIQKSVTFNGCSVY